MWSRLIWKSFTEQRWKLALNCVLLVGFTLITLRSRLFDDQTTLLWLGIMGGLALPLFVAMGLVAPLRHEGSHETLIALPIRPWKSLAVAVGAGLVCCWVPLALSGAVALALAGNREESTHMVVQSFLAAGAMGAVVVVWTLAFSIRQAQESRVGLIGLGMLVLWGVVLGAEASVATLCDHAEWVGEGRTLLLINPWSLLHLQVDQGRWAWLIQSISAQVVWCVLLWFWMVRRYVRQGVGHE